MTGQQLAAFKAAGLPAVDMSKFRSVIRGAAQAAKAAATGSLLLRLLKDGLWVYGPDDVEVQDGSQWVINPFSLAMGYAAWGLEKTPNEGTLMGERMALITDIQVNPHELPDIVDAPWNAQVQFDALCLTGEDVGALVRYKTTSTGGRRAFAGMMAEVSQHADDDGMIVPVVEFQSDSYQHKKWGKTYVPMFTVAEWRAPDDTELDTSDDGAQHADGEADAPTETETTQRRRPAANGAAAQNAEPQPETVRTRRPAANAVKPDVKDAPSAPAAGAQSRRRAPVEGTASKAATSRRAPVKGADAKTTPAKEPVDRGAVVRRRRR